MRFESFRHMLSYWAQQRPDAPALRYESRTRSFSELYLDVLTRAEELKSAGRSCIGILADGSLACVEEIFAANLAGLQIVMLDAMAPEPLLKTLIRYTDIDTLWGDEDLCEELEPALMGGVSDGAGKFLFVTSGTTEQAKAVVLTDHSLCQSAWNGSAKLPLQPEDTLLCMLPLGHVFGFVCGLLWGLSCGACVALGRGARHYADDCAFYKPTAVSVVPLLLGFLLRQGCVNEELALILVGAGDCPAQLLQAAAARGIRVSFGYGLTETSSGVAISVQGDPFAMEVCPDDTITLAEDGEILIEAPTCMMQGYYKDPEGTRAALPDGKVLRTGDLGEWTEEGLLRIKGRKKEILVFPDGTKIFLPEYEAGLAPLLPERDFAVIEAGGAPVLAVKGAPEEEAAIAAAIRPRMEALPRGQQIQRIVMIPTPLPRTATGKIKRWELRQKVRG